MSARTADSESADAGVAVTVNAPTAAKVATAARVRDRGSCESRGRHATGWPVSFFRQPPTGLAVGFGRGRCFALRRQGAAPIHPKGNVWVPGSNCWTRRAAPPYDPGGRLSRNGYPEGSRRFSGWTRTGATTRRKCPQYRRDRASAARGAAGPERRDVDPVGTGGAAVTARVVL